MEQPLGKTALHWATVLRECTIRTRWHRPLSRRVWKGSRHHSHGWRKGHLLKNNLVWLTCCYYCMWGIGMYGHAGRDQRQLCRIGSLFSHGSWRLNSGHQRWDAGTFTIWAICTHHKVVFVCLFSCLFVFGERDHARELGILGGCEESRKEKNMIKIYCLNILKIKTNTTWRPFFYEF